MLSDAHLAVVSLVLWKLKKKKKWINRTFTLEKEAGEKHNKVKHISLFTTLGSLDNQSVMNERSEGQRGSGSDQFQPPPFYRIKWFTLVHPPLCHVVCSNPVFKSGSLKVVLFMNWKPVQSRKQLQHRIRRKKRWGKKKKKTLSGLGIALEVTTVTGGGAKTKERACESPGCQSRWCFNRVCAVSVCCHSLSSTVPAGEGALAVPGLVLCPSIPQELCDRTGDCESRQRYCNLSWLIPNSAALVSMTVVFLRSFSRSALNIYHFQNTAQTDFIVTERGE